VTPASEAMTPTICRAVGFSPYMMNVTAATRSGPVEMIRSALIASVYCSE